MKFPRNSKILRSQFDVAPFAAVFFIVVIFVMLGAMMPVPGLHAQLTPPTANDLPGIDGRKVAMAVDPDGRIYYDNQAVTERVLINKLTVAARTPGAPVTLIIHADRAVTYDQIAHLTLLARSAGITNALLATLPRVTDAPAK